MRRVIKTLVVVAAAALVSAPASARAEGYVSPWAGVNFAGGGLENGRGSFGVQAGGMGAGIIGGEVDFGYSPSAFGTQNDFGNNSVIDLMGNVIVGIPVGGTYGAGFRPFVTGGLGLIRTQIDGGSTFRVASSSNNLGKSRLRRHGVLQRARRHPRRPALLPHVERRHHQRPRPGRAPLLEARRRRGHSVTGKGRGHASLNPLPKPATPPPTSVRRRPSSMRPRRAVESLQSVPSADPFNSASSFGR